MLLVLALLLCAAVNSGSSVIPVSSSSSSCFHQSSSGRYDLSPLKTLPGHDNMGNAIAANVCAHTHPALSGCDGGPVPAHLIRRLGGSCHAVGVGSTPHPFSDLPDALGVLATFDTPGELCSTGEREEGGVHIRVTCGDQPLPTLSMGETQPCRFEGDIVAREGCPLECARDPATGAVCGGPSRGTCQSGSGGGLATCVCVDGLEGPLCTSGGASVLDLDGPTSGSVSTTLWISLLGVVGLVGATIYSQQQQQQQQRQQQQLKQTLLLFSDGRLFVGGVAALLSLVLLLSGELEGRKFSGGKVFPYHPYPHHHHHHLSHRSSGNSRDRGNPHFPLPPHSVEASLGGGMLALPTAEGVLPPRTRPFPPHLALTNHSSRRCVGRSQGGDGMGSFPSEQYPGQKGPEDPRNHFCELRDVCIVGGKVVYYMDAITAAAAIAAAEATTEAVAAAAAAAAAAAGAGASEEGEGSGESGSREPSPVEPSRRLGRGVGKDLDGGGLKGTHLHPSAPDLTAPGLAGAAGLEFHFSNWAFRQEKPLWSPTLSGEPRPPHLPWAPPDRVYMLDELSYVENYGHFLYDNVSPMVSAAEVLGYDPLLDTQLVSSRACGDGTYLLAGSTVDGTGMRGEDACADTLGRWSGALLAYPPLVAPRDAPNFCVRRLVVGYSAAFSHSAMFMHRVTAARTLRRAALARELGVVVEVEGGERYGQVSLPPPPTHHRIAVYVKRVEHRGEHYPELCGDVQAWVEVIRRGGGGGGGEGSGGLQGEVPVPVVVVVDCLQPARQSVAEQLLDLAGTTLVIAEAGSTGHTAALFGLPGGGLLEVMPDDVPEVWMVHRRAKEAHMHLYTDTQTFYYMKGELQAGGGAGGVAALKLVLNRVGEHLGIPHIH